MIELFAVPPAEDAAFLAAWSAEAPAGATLHRALRADVPYRFAGSAAGGPDAAGGVLLIVPFEVPDGEDARFPAAWEEVREVFSPAAATSARRCTRARTRAPWPSSTGRAR